MIVERLLRKTNYIGGVFFGECLHSLLFSKPSFIVNKRRQHMSIKKSKDENLKQYKVRLYKNKDAYGLSNIEIGNLINKESGDNLDESAHRKWATPYIEGYEDAMSAGLTDEDLLNEIDEKMDALYKQQVKTRDKLRESRTDLRNEARIENLKDVFKDCAITMSKSDPICINTYPKSSGERVGILQISDWHYAEVVNNFMNTYNKDVFNQRIDKLTSDTISYCKLMEVKTLKVLNMGDLMSGNIHVSSRVNSEEDIIEQTMYVSEVLAKMLAKISESIELVELHSVLDNHSRINKNKKEHIEKESFGMFIPWFLETRLSDIKNIKIVQNKIDGFEELNIGMVDIFHEKAYFVHGHEDKVASVISDLTLMTKSFPIAIFIGHLHQNMEKEMHGIDMIMNPSLIGIGEYGKSIRKTSKPRQKLTVYENTNSEVERVCTFFINL